MKGLTCFVLCLIAESVAVLSALLMFGLEIIGFHVAHWYVFIPLVAMLISYPLAALGVLLEYLSD